MASPFHIFRKHQRAMLAVVGILCMIGFSISGVGFLGNMSDPAVRGEDPVVATAYGKTLRESEVYSLMRQRGLAIRFLGAAIRSGMGELGRFINPEAFLENVFGPATREAVVQTWVLAERARRMGVVISDEAINDYLKRMTEDKVRPEVLRAIVKEQQSTQPEVFEALRHELLAFRLREMSLQNVEATPAQRWDYYRRMNQQAVAEVMPLPVEDFVDEVDDPSDEELAAFFESHKDREPRPDSPEPGFKVPKKAAFEVLIARYEDFDDPDAIGEEEVKEFYEKNKDQRYLYSQHSFTDWDDEPADEPDSATETKGDDEKGPNEKGADGKDSDNKDGSNDGQEKDSDKNDSDKEDGVSLRQPMHSTEGASFDSPGRRPGIAVSRTPSPQRGDIPGVRRTGNRAPLGLPTIHQSVDPGLRPGLSNDAASRLRARGLAAALNPAMAIGGLLAADEDGADESATKKADVDGADEPKGDADLPDTDADALKTSPSETAAKQDAQEKPATKKPAKKIPTIAPPITDELTLPRDIRKGENPKYAPLWKVEPSIRKELSRTKANEKIEKALQAVQGKMRQFSQRRLGAASKSAKIDLEKLAAEHGLSVLRTGLLTAYELQEKYPELAAARGEGSGINFLSIAYTALAVYQSTIVQDTDANRYLFWKTKDEAAYVPEFAEIRSKVLHTWKLVRAREVAEKKARELADEADKAGKPLKDLFADRGMTVIQTQPFSWMSRGSASPDGRGPLELSDVEGVERPGPDFMREVFSLGVGNVGEALNQPKTVAYVIRVTSLQPPRELLRSAFMASPFMLYAEAGNEHRQQIVEAWRKGVEAEANLTWVKTADDDPSDR